MDLIIAPGGRMRCVYGELLDLGALGRMAIRRASHVEPDAGGRWYADLSPVSGPRLGPFPRRSDALQAERRWLARHWLPRARPLEDQRPSRNDQIPMTNDQGGMTHDEIRMTKGF